MSLESGLVSTDWLADHLDDPSVKLLEATLHMFDTGRDARAEYDAGHIPGARFFDIDAASDEVSELPHMLPPPEIFAGYVRRLSISNADTVIVYDRSDLHSAARAWWMFRVFGHENVAVLDGGFQKWQAEGREVSRDVLPVVHGHFLAGFRRDLVASIDDVRKAQDTEATVILDARSKDRFTGKADEPRPEVRSGHIPGSRNLPYGKLFADDGSMRSSNDIEKQLAAVGISADTPVVTSCGTGITASVLALGLYQIGNHAARVYDGSWVEWATRPDAEIDTGE